MWCGRPLAALAMLGVLTTACTDGSVDRAVGGRTSASPPAVAGAEPSGSDAGRVRVTTVAELDELVTSLVVADDEREMLVATRSGRLRRLVRREVRGSTVPTLVDGLVLDLSDRVTTEFDRGFLNMAMVDGGRSLVVMYVGPDGDLFIEQYPFEPGQPIDREAVRPLLTLRWRYPFHHGGGLALDAEGNLLLALGEKGLSLPGIPASQDPDLLLGGILSIPADVLSGEETSWEPTPDQMFARGLRNPWRIALGPTGDVWIGDVGNLVAEEIDVVPADAIGREVVNFGYPYYEGTTQRSREKPQGEFVEPVLERVRDEGVCGMVLGAVYRGTALGALRGEVMHSDLCDPEIRAFSFRDGRVVRDRGVGLFPAPVVAFAEGAGGELYGLGSTGGIYRLDPAGWEVDHLDQRVDASSSSTTEPVEKVQCGVAEATEPLDYLGDADPETLRQELAMARAQLAERVPMVPPDARRAAKEIERFIGELDDVLAVVGWDIEDPALASLRAQMIDATGPFEHFPEAIAELFNSSCS